MSSTEPNPDPDLPPITIEAVPNTTMFSYVDPGGVDYTVATVSWDPVAVYEDGSAAEIASYVVDVSVDGGSTFAGAVSVPGDQVIATLPAVVSGSDIYWQVRAVATSGQSSGPSEQVLVHLPADGTPPPVASTPIVTSKLSVVSIRWDGGFVAGAARPEDFLTTDVHISDVNGFTPTTATLAGSLKAAGTLQLIGQGIGAVRYVKLITKDLRLNASLPSTQATVTIVGVTGPDIEANSVTANEIHAGAIDGMVVTGAQIQTAFTGARGVFDTTGLNFYNSAGDNVASLTPSAVQITGTFRTGKVGTPRVEMLNRSYTGPLGATATLGGVYFYDTATYLSQPSVVLDSTGTGSSTLSISPGRVTGGPSVAIRLTRDNGAGAAVVDIDTYNTAGVGASLAQFSRDVNKGTTLTASPGAISLIGGVGNVLLIGPNPNVAGSPNDEIAYNARNTHRFTNDNSPYDRFVITNSGNYIAGQLFFRPLGNTSTSGWLSYDGGNEFQYRAQGVHTFVVAGTTRGQITTAGFTAMSTMGTTTGSANVSAQGTDNVFLKSTSLGKYKLDQEPIVANYGILELMPKTWIDKGQREEFGPNVMKRQAGFIAEEVLALSDRFGGAFDSLLAYSDYTATELRGLDYDRFIAFLIPVVRDMAKDIKELKTRVSGI